MIRFIVKATQSIGDGAPHISYYTIDAVLPELESALARGGITGAAYESHSLIGAEILAEAATEKETERGPD